MKNSKLSKLILLAFFMLASLMPPKAGAQNNCPNPTSDTRTSVTNISKDNVPSFIIVKNEHNKNIVRAVYNWFRSGHKVKITRNISPPPTVDPETFRKDLIKAIDSKKTVELTVTADLNNCMAEDDSDDSYPQYDFGNHNDACEPKKTRHKSCLITNIQASIKDSPAPRSGFGDTGPIK